MKKDLTRLTHGGRRLFLWALAAFSLPFSHAVEHVLTVSSDGRMVNLRTVYPSVGDTIKLPALTDAAADKYVVGNTNIAEMADATTLKILAPGATSVAYYTGSSVATWNDCADVVVPPDPKGDGCVFVWVRTANDGSGNWNDASNWTHVRGSSGRGYPNAVDDVAMCFVNGQRKWMQITINTDVTLGALWTGSVRHQHSSGSFAARFKGSNKLAFESGEGEAELHVLGSATDGEVHVHNLGYSSTLPIEIRSSLVVDLGYTNGLRTSNSSEFLQFNHVDLTLPEGKTIAFRNIKPTNHGAASYTIDFSSNFSVSGSGAIFNQSGATVGKFGDWSGFTGTYVESGSGHKGYHTNFGNPNLHQSYTNNPAAKLVVRGFPEPKGAFTGGLSVWGGFGGFVGVKGSSATNPGNRLNYAEVSMEGGFMELRPDAKEGWDDPLLVSAPGKLVVREGYNGIRLYDSATETHPTNVLDLVDLAHESGAMLSIYEPMSAERTNTTDAVRGWVKVRNFTQHAIGGEDDVVDAVSGSKVRSYKIIPWLVSPRDTDGGRSQFYGVNEDGVLVTALSREGARLQDMTGGRANAAMENEWSHLSDESDVVAVNSLYERNVEKARHYVNTGRRLEITSGGIILSFNGLIGNVGDSGEGDDSKAGVLYLPNRGYVWGVNPHGQDNSGQIWQKTEAPEGVSFAAVNNNAARLTLGGDQRGIKKDIAINCGKLILGNDTVGCKLNEALEVRIVGASSILEIPAPSARALRNNRVVLRDVGGYPAKISIPEGVSVTMKNLVVKHDDGTEVPLKPGVYAAAPGEGVTHVDPHFVGAGRVVVPNPGLRVIVR